VRLQSPEWRIASRESWRQANNAELRHGDARTCGLRRYEYKLTTRRTWADKETPYLYCKKKDACVAYVQYRGANVTAIAGKKR